MNKTEFRDDRNCLFATIWIEEDRWTKKFRKECVVTLFNQHHYYFSTGEQLLRSAKLIREIEEYVQTLEYRVQLGNLQREIESLPDDEHKTGRTEILDRDMAELIKDNSRREVRKLALNRLVAEEMFNQITKEKV